VSSALSGARYDERQHCFACRAAHSQEYIQEYKNQRGAPAAVAAATAPGARAPVLTAAGCVCRRRRHDARRWPGLRGGGRPRRGRPLPAAACGARNGGRRRHDAPPAAAFSTRRVRRHPVGRRGRRRVRCRRRRLLWRAGCRAATVGDRHGGVVVRSHPGMFRAGNVGGVVAVCFLLLSLSSPWPCFPPLIHLSTAPWSALWLSPARVPACRPGWPQTPRPDGAPRAPPLARGSATCPSAPVALAPPPTLLLSRSARVAAVATRLFPDDPRCCGSHAIHRQRSCRAVQFGSGHRQVPNPGRIAPPG